MKILFTGGGTAGHFFPLIAIAEAVNSIAEEEKLVTLELFYMSPNVLDQKMLFNNDIKFIWVPSGKSRLYFSLLNITDMFALLAGILKALWSMYLIYPDVVVSKGGWASIPAVFAARVLRIPIIIHESDAVPGRANLWAAKFATRIAVSWAEATEFFPKEKTAITSQPVRKAILKPARHGAKEYLGLKEDIPTILFLGGSQGAQAINEAVIGALSELLSSYQIIHQTGVNHIDEIKRLSNVILTDHEHKNRYKPFGFLDDLALRMSAGVATLVVSRGGSVIFEIASWRLPSIIVPITKSNKDHQRKNAFSYARSGAGIVLDEANLTPHVLKAEIDRLIENKEEREAMIKAAQKFFKPDAAFIIAKEAIKIALSHES